MREITVYTCTIPGSEEWKRDSKQNHSEAQSARTRDAKEILRRVHRGRRSTFPSPLHHGKGHRNRMERCSDNILTDGEK
jgi:hypothetical protein